MFNVISYLIFIYLFIFAIYFLTLTVRSFKAKNYIREQYEQFVQNTEKNRLCVIIWASDKNKNLFELLNALNHQTYSKEYYDIHVIYKNTGLSTTVIPDFAHGARIHSIENPEFFSKDKAISMFLERIITENKYDAFVFLGADRMVETSYLEIINRKLVPNMVITGSVRIIEGGCGFWQNIFATSLAAKVDLTNNTINIARAMFDLCQTIDGDNCVITADIIEKIGRVCFETRNEELKYSLFLAGNDIKPLYCPLIATTINARDYNATQHSFKQACSLFGYYLSHLRKKSWYFIEYLISIFRPTTFFLLIGYSLLLVFSFRFLNTIGIRYVLHLGVFLVFVMVLGIISSRISFKKICCLILSPIPLFVIKFAKITKKLSIKLIKKQQEEEGNVNSATINAIVTNGKKDASCKLDLVTEDGMRKVVFRYKKKRFESSEHLRMYDALENMTKSLEEKGFTLKVCQNCSWFTPDHDATVDLLKGFCGAYLQYKKQQQEQMQQMLEPQGAGSDPAQILDNNAEPLEESGTKEGQDFGDPILIWNCCRNFHLKRGINPTAQ